MTDTEVITKAIKKAEASGWDVFCSQYSRVFKDANLLMVEFLLEIDRPPLIVSYERVIFSHDFAEHFWGMDTWYYVVHLDRALGMDSSVIGWKSERDMMISGKEWNYYENIPAYEYHLQQIALEDSQDARIAYIEKYL